MFTKLCQLYSKDLKVNKSTEARTKTSVEVQRDVQPVECLEVEKDVEVMVANAVEVVIAVEKEVEEDPPPKVTRIY